MRLGLTLRPGWCALSLAALPLQIGKEKRYDTKGPNRNRNPNFDLKEEWGERDGDFHNNYTYLSREFLNPGEMTVANVHPFEYASHAGTPPSRNPTPVSPSNRPHHAMRRRRLPKLTLQIILSWHSPIALTVEMRVWACV